MPPKRSCSNKQPVLLSLWEVLRKPNWYCFGLDVQPSIRLIAKTNARARTTTSPPKDFIRGRIPLPPLTNTKCIGKTQGKSDESEQVNAGKHNVFNTLDIPLPRPTGFRPMTLCSYLAVKSPLGDSCKKLIGTYAGN